MHKLTTAMALSVVLFFVLSLPAHSASHEHGKAEHGMTHSGEDMSSPSTHGHPEHRGEVIHKSKVQGYSFTYELIDVHARMKTVKGMEKMMNKAKSHHLMVYVKNASGHAMKDGKVGFLIQGPDGSKQKLMAMGMVSGFGADADLKAKGEYTIKTKVVAGDKKLLDSFTYTVK